MKLRELLDMGVEISDFNLKAIIETHKYDDRELLGYVILKAHHQGKKIQSYACIWRGDKVYYCIINGKRASVSSAVAFINTNKFKQKKVESEDLLKRAMLDAI